MKYLIKILPIIVSTCLLLCTCSEKDDDNQIQNISINPPSLNLVEGESAKIEIIVTPTNADRNILIYSSSDESIATIDKNGDVTGVKAGKAVILVYTPDRKKAAECFVNVVPQLIPATSISLSEESLVMKVGDEYSLEAFVLPENATDKNVIWNSSDNSIVTVDKNGKIKAKQIGSAVISASVESGKVSAECQIIVEPIPVISIKLSHKNVKLHVGSVIEISASLEPSNATDKTIKWSSSDNSVVTVDEGKVKGIKIGKAIVSASADDGKVTETCEVEVIPFAVTGIELDVQSLKLMSGDQKQLKYIITPENADNKEVIWSVQDETIASVNTNGLVTAKKNGTTKVVVKTVDGGFTAECKVDVVGIDGMISAKITGGTIIEISGTVQAGSSLTAKIANESKKTIRIKSLQVLNGSTLTGGNENTIEEDLNGNSSKSYTVKLGVSVYKPVIRFKYEYEGKTFIVDAPYQ